MISCHEAVRQLWEFLDADIAEGDRERVEEHLAFCRRCCGELEFAGELRQMLRSAARPAMPADVEDRLEGCLRSIEEVETP